MKYYQLNKARKEMTLLKNEADEKGKEVCSKEKVKHNEMND